jgi:hypothetical protein
LLAVQRGRITTYQLDLVAVVVECSPLEQPVALLQQVALGVLAAAAEVPVITIITVAPLITAALAVMVLRLFAFIFEE